MEVFGVGDYPKQGKDSQEVRPLKTAAAVPMTSAGLLTNKPESVPASGAGQSAPLPGCNAW